jgi:hypothetical protein
MWVGCQLGTATAFHWERDFATAVRRAQRADKVLLLAFVGSDWDGWSMTLEQQIFADRTFISFADDNLVGVWVDFPQGVAMSAEELDRNERLRSAYDVQELPTVVLVNPDGDELGRTGYRDGGANEYVRHLRALIAAGQAAATNRPVDAAADTETEPDMRTWTNVRGVTIEAAFVSATTNTVTLRAPGGTQQTVPRATLSQFDNDYIDAQQGVTGR